MSSRPFIDASFAGFDKINMIVHLIAVPLESRDTLNNENRWLLPDSTSLIN